MDNMRFITVTSLLALSCYTGGIQAATILHGNGNSAISHHSFTRVLSATPKSSTPLNLRIFNGMQAQPHHFFPKEDDTKQAIPQHTPAHLTYSAHPVVHQMLPRIKPVENISFASLVPGPRSLATKITQHYQHHHFYPDTSVSLVNNILRAH